MQCVSLIPTKDEMNLYITIANAAAKSNHVKNMGGADGILCIMLYAKELGISPMQAIYGGIHNIQGNMTLSARMMNSMILRAGNTITVLEQNEKICKLKGTRADNGETCICEYTIEEVERANLLKNPSWKNYPSDMLYKSCLSRLARRLFSDTISTAYIEGEIVEKSEKTIQSNVIQIQPTSSEVSQIQHVEQSPQTVPDTLSAEEVSSVLSMIGENNELLERILNGYSKKYGKQVKSLQDILARDFESLYSTLKVRLEDKGFECSTEEAMQA